VSEVEQIAAVDRRPLPAGRRQRLKIAAAMAVLLAVLLMPPQPGLSAEGQRVLAVVAAAVVLWATEALPLALSSMAVVALLVILGGVDAASDALVGFSSPIVFFLLGSLAMGSAVMQSGLAERLAGYLIDSSRGSTGRLVAQLLIALPFMAFLIPSAINRNAILIPAYERAFRSLEVERGGRMAKVVMLTLGMMNPLTSSAFMTGGLAPMTTSTLLGGFTWFRWFTLMAVPYYLLMGLGGILIYLLYRPTAKVAATMEIAAPSRRRFSVEEKATLAVIALTSALWLTDFVHHWNPAIPALIAAVLLMTPGLGVLEWSGFQRTVNWSSILFIGASLSLTQALIASGAAAWFAQALLSAAAGGFTSPAALAIQVILITAVVHLGIPNQAACIALLIPVITAFAAATGVSPVAAGLVVGIAVDTVIVYSVQTVTILLAYETGHLRATDILKVGLGMLVLTIAVVVFVAIPWWGVMGLAFA
jgi:anion transporter